VTRVETVVADRPPGVRQPYERLAATAVMVVVTLAGVSRWRSETAVMAPPQGGRDPLARERAALRFKHIPTAPGLSKALSRS
jgi:hypothetical protein